MLKKERKIEIQHNQTPNYEYNPVLYAFKLRGKYLRLNYSSFRGIINLWLQIFRYGSVKADKAIIET